MTQDALTLDQALRHLAELVQEQLVQEQAHPVGAVGSPREVGHILDLQLKESGLDLEQLLGQTKELLKHTPHTASPRFFNQLFGGRDNIAVLGECLAAVLNNSMYTYKVGGAQVLLELELVRHMGALMGFRHPEGVLTPGGSLSNLCALLIARNQKCPGIQEIGADGQRLRVYTSMEAHYSVDKAVTVLGLGRQNLVKIQVDDRGRMCPQDLERAIESDLAAGFLPVMINATMGTTVLGAFDPIDSLADIAQRHGLWLHADGSFGGTVILHHELKEELKGIERADSITWDAHKLMGVPLTCSMILVREQGLLTDSLHEAATYLFQDDEDLLNPGTRSLQCGRRNDALKLWMAWKHHGNEGYAERLDALRGLTMHARNEVLSRPTFQLIREPESFNLVFQIQGVESDVLCTELNRRQIAMISHAIVEGQTVVRLALQNPSVTREEISALFDDLESVAQNLRNARPAYSKAADEG